MVKNVDGSRGTETSILGRSKAIEEVRSVIKKVAPSESTVLIMGESGTGKELVAKAVHLNSPRSSQQFVPVNCAAMAETLLESELFGHVRGAFTGANRHRKGLIEEADGGTFFLDEITETSAAFQAKLLRVLQEGEIRRVGDNSAIKVNVRIVSATNRDLAARVRNGAFREDLYYRLNVVEIVVPPLREREDDIALLAQHFLQKYAPTGRDIKFTVRAMARLQQHDWPGNVRQLENIVQRAAVLTSGALIDEADLPSLELRPTANVASERRSDASDQLLRLDHLRSEHHVDSVEAGRWERVRHGKDLPIEFHAPRMVTALHVYDREKDAAFKDLNPDDLWTVLAGVVGWYSKRERARERIVTVLSVWSQTPGDRYGLLLSAGGASTTLSFGEFMAKYRESLYALFRWPPPESISVPWRSNGTAAFISVIGLPTTERAEEAMSIGSRATSGEVFSLSRGTKVLSLMKDPASATAITNALVELRCGAIVIDARDVHEFHGNFELNVGALIQLGISVIVPAAVNVFHSPTLASGSLKMSVRSATRLMLDYDASISPQTIARTFSELPRCCIRALGRILVNETTGATSDCLQELKDSGLIKQEFSTDLNEEVWILARPEWRSHWDSWQKTRPSR